MKKFFLIAIISISSITASVGCKQGLGERCQINDDCVSPYVCNQAKMQCQQTTTGGIDATVVDAPFTTVDAPFTIIDAAADAPADSTAVDAPLD